MERKDDRKTWGHPIKIKNMNTVLPIDKRNAVLSQMAVLLEERTAIQRKISKISPTIPVVI
jgi:hypothetical protein